MQPETTLFALPVIREEPSGQPGTLEGTIGEHRAIAELLSRGYEVAVPAVDSGHDLYILADKHYLSVQVKCVKTRPHHGSERTMVTARNGWRSDVNLCHVAGHGWWVIPRSAIRSKHCFALYPPTSLNQRKPSASLYAPYHEAWHVIEELLCRAA